MNETHAPTTSADAPIVTEDPQAEDGCPIAHDRAPHPTQGGGDRRWWPNSLNLKVLAKNPAHRDMDPEVRYLGADVPTEDLIWQDSLLEATTLAEADIAAPKQQMAASGLTLAQLVSTAWAAASSFRGRGKRGGANGARIRHEPQRSWEVNVHMLAGMP
jgi:catalase (peroxidase I)